MLKIFNQKVSQHYIGILNDNVRFSTIEHHPAQASVIELNKDKLQVSCLSCMFPKCMIYEKDEIRSSNDKFKNFPMDVTDIVCPTGALIWNKDAIYPNIDKSLCINCGLCASRCPIGAIYLNKDGAAISTRSEIIKLIEANSSNIELQDAQLNELQKVTHIGLMIEESEELFSHIYTKMNLIKAEAQFPNILTRNLLIQTGNRCFIRRKGDVYLRIDALMELPEEVSGIIEIEFNKDSLESPRAILDDMAVLNSRYNIELSSMVSFIISLEFPNIRSEYWRLMKDIYNVLGVQINSLSIGALMLFVWNFKKLDFINRSFYADVDNSSIQETSEYIITRKINTTSEHVAVFGIKK